MIFSRPAWLGLLLVGVNALAAPRVPTDDREVIEHLPLAVTQQASQLRQLRARWQAMPREPAGALDLTERYIAIARSESDPRYYGAAEGVLTQSFDAELPPRALVLRAAIRQARHAFVPALRDLKRALAVEPRNAQAWLTAASIQRVTGDYPAARRSCAALGRLAEPLVIATCVASVGMVSGAAAASEAILQRQLERSPSGDPQVQQWALTTLAEIAESRGESVAAERAYRAALAQPLRSVYLKVTYADFLLAQQRPREVLSLLADELRHDGALLRRALAASALHHPDAERHVNALKARFAAGRARGSTLHQGEEARFSLELLHDPVAALPLALANWTLQREIRDARIVLEAARAAAAPVAALPVIDFLNANKAEDLGLRALIAALARDN